MTGGDVDHERRERARQERARLRQDRAVASISRTSRDVRSADRVLLPPTRPIAARITWIVRRFVAEVLDIAGGCVWPVLALVGVRRRRTHVSAAAPLTESQRRAVAARSALLRRRIRAALAAGCLVMVVVAAVALPRSELFAIRHVEITGARAVSDLDLRMRIDGQLRGRTVFTVDEAALVRRVKDMPFIRSVRVERHLPGGLQLRVIEYRPLALGYGSGSFWLVSRDGRILAAARRSDWVDRVPTVTLRTRRLQPGVRLRNEPALELLEARGGRTMLAFDTIDSAKHRLVARLTGGVEVRFGRPVQLRQKALVADKLLRDARRRGRDLLYVDVSVASRPAICQRSVPACNMPRVGSGTLDARSEVVATTPEEAGGDEALTM